MSQEQVIILDHFQEDTLSQLIPSLTVPSMLNSDRAGWRNIHLAHFCSPDTPWETPDYHSQQIMIGIPSSVPYSVTQREARSDDRSLSNPYY